MGRLSAETIQLALISYRDGNWLELATSPLAHHPIVDGYFLSNDPVTDDVRARAVVALLRWSIQRLRPNTQHDWFDNAWRQYNIIHYHFMEGWRVADLAAQMGITEQTFYNWRPAALNAVGRIVQQEIRHPRDFEGRRRVGVYARADSADCHACLRALAIFEAGRFIPQTWLTQFVPNTPISLRGLRQTGLVEIQQGAVGGARLRLHEAARPYIYALLTQDERRRWHGLAGTLHRQTGAYVAAARQLRAAGRFEHAAQILIDHQQEIFDRTQVQELNGLLTLFTSAELTTPDLWAKLKIVAGRVAEYLEDLDTALREYGAALGAKDIATRARAYQERARLLQRVDLDECLTHYAVCIEMLERTGELSAELTTLLTRMIINRAWIFIQERPDHDRAEAALIRAQATAPQHDSLIWSQLYNAWAGLRYQQRRLQDAIEYRLKAWVAACAAQNAEEMMKTAYNLGQGYVWIGEYDRALDYFHKSQALATESGNVQMQGVIQKGIGSSLFLQGDAAAAIPHYRRAYETWFTTKNANYRANSCYDLAEAYAEVGDWRQARQLYEEGVALAQQLDHARYQQEFAELAQRYPSLCITLDPHQQAALRHVREHGSIASGEFIDLLGISKRKALAALKQMVAQGVLEKRGQGRSVRYFIDKSL